MTGGEGQSISVLLDENVERQVLTYLEAAGHDGEHVVDVLGPGVEDSETIAPYAKEHDHVVITKDTDFLAMEPESHAGVFFVENHRQTAYEIATGVVRAVDAVPNRDSLRGTVFVDDWR